MIYCPECRSALPDTAKFCDKCGASIAADTSAPVISPPVKPLSVHGTEKKKNPVMLILIAALCVIIVILCIAIAVVASGNNESRTPHNGSGTHNTIDSQEGAYEDYSPGYPTADTETLPEPRGLDMRLISYAYGEFEAGTINLYEDFTFSMTVNLYEGWGNITGGYYVAGDGTICCTVYDKDFWGFAGDDLQSFMLGYAEGPSYPIYLEGMQYCGAVEDGALFYPY